MLGNHTASWLFAIALVIVVFLIYQPAWNGGFLWDDDLHLLNNPVLKPGGLARIWVPGTYINYWPLTSTAYWLQFKIWGLDPLGFHMVNIALHAISALLLWRVLLQLRSAGGDVRGGHLRRASGQCGERGLDRAVEEHPLADSGAHLRAVLFAVRAAKAGDGDLPCRSASFLLSTLAKGMGLTLPVVLLACDWWQRGRITRRDLLRVLPYFLIAAPMVLHGDIHAALRGPR